MHVRLYTVKAFSTDPTRGNLVGVVLNAPRLSPTEMQRLARLSGASETALVFSSEDADACIRWFSPAGEVTRCIHATVAAGELLRRRFHRRRSLRLESPGGAVRVSFAASNRTPGTQFACDADKRQPERLVLEQPCEPRERHVTPDAIPMVILWGDDLRHTTPLSIPATR
jgi:PhzF family phenazine biosynthesis protein